MSSKSVLQILTRVPSKKCQVRVSEQSVSQARVSSKSVVQECQVRVSYKSVKSECLTRVSSKSPRRSVKQECRTRVSEKSVSQARMSHKSVK